MVGILQDPNYAESLWCRNLYESLVEQLRRKRVSFCDLTDTVPEVDGVFVIASDRQWMQSVISQFNRFGIQPILVCNHSEQLPGCIYSYVCSDIHASMKNLLDLLAAHGKRRVALYGMNTDSASDLSRVDSLFHWRGDQFETMDFFPNEGSLEDCFGDFFPHIDRFDAVICANDFAAISLVRYLRQSAPEKLRDLSVISCAQTRIANYYRDSILSLDMHFEQYGKAAVYVYHALQKHSYLSGMTARVSWSLAAPATLQPSYPLQLQLPPGQDAFYRDSQLGEMLIVDKLLQCADPVEQTILDCLLSGLTTEQIAERCFLTEGAVKYRIKKILSDSGAEDKQQIIALLKKYLPGG